MSSHISISAECSTRPLRSTLAVLFAVFFTAMLVVSVSPAYCLPIDGSSDEAPAEEEKNPEDLKNTIKWQTSSEVDNFGFDVFRADSAEGPWEQVNPDTIEGQGTTDEITSYAFEDRTIDPCRAYFYYVESISMSGDREHFTPVGLAKAKLSADDPRCAEASVSEETDSNEPESEESSSEVSEPSGDPTRQ